jgi:hypothetical protein
LSQLTLIVPLKLIGVSCCQVIPLRTAVALASAGALGRAAWVQAGAAESIVRVVIAVKRRFAVFMTIDLLV